MDAGRQRGTYCEREGFNVTGGQSWKYARSVPIPGKVCVECGGGTRPAPFPGPRCATHDRAKRQATKLAAAGRRVEKTYGLTPDEYEALYRAQGGVCFVCRRATGATKRLAVDHDHGCCPGPTSCGECVRGLLCLICNRTMGHYRDSAETAQRAADYLRRSPTGWSTVHRGRRV